ncbi:hypothetical protein [Xanthomonas cannabis]|uniref:hypothetical protein n=1 Tax=Xanthomonas cannabis TaxID=1885674 RepID=UPI00111271AC|nr:hypothetical protein [Xanthomonas cannabis]
MRARIVPDARVMRCRRWPQSALALMHMRRAVERAGALQSDAALIANAVRRKHSTPRADRATSDGCAVGRRIDAARQRRVGQHRTQSGTHSRTAIAWQPACDLRDRDRRSNRGRPSSGGPATSTGQTSQMRWAGVIARPIALLAQRACAAISISFPD